MRKSHSRSSATATGLARSHVAAAARHSSFVIRISTSRAFTLVELLISIAVMTFLLLVLSEMTSAAGRAWRNGQNRTDAFQSGRTALEIVSRELTPAVVDTRTQFVVAPGSILTSKGANNVAAGSPALLWMSPLGPEGSLVCVGYYLLRDDTRQYYRLERIYIPPTNSTGAASAYFPKMVNAGNPQDPTTRTSATDASWFTQTWDANAFNEFDPTNTSSVVSSAADGVVAFWAQSLDLLGNPIPLVSNSTVHPPSQLAFNSAAYFQMATSTAFENGASFVYLAKTPQSMKANRLPAAIDLTTVVLENSVLQRGAQIPTQVNDYSANGALDVNQSLADYQTALQKNHIYNARVFTTRVKLANGN